MHFVPLPKYSVPTDQVHNDIIPGIYLDVDNSTYNIMPENLCFGICITYLRSTTWETVLLWNDNKKMALP